MKNIVIALLALVFLPATVFAGGGSKNSTQLELSNNSTSAVLVTVNPTLSDAQLIAVAPANWASNGIFMLNPGQKKSFKVNAGSNVVKALFPDLTGMTTPVVGDLSTKTVNATANTKTVVGITGAFGSPPTIN